MRISDVSSDVCSSDLLPFLPPAASQQRTSKVMLEIEEALADHPAIYETISFGGADPYTFMPKTNMGFSFVTLKPWDQRKEEHLKSPALVAEIMALNDRIKIGRASCRERVCQYV